MLNTPAIQILRVLNKEEFNQFDDFIRSPFFNKSKTITKLWDSIKKFAPEFDSEKLNREIVFTHVYPGKEYNHGTMRNLLHSFNALFEPFLTQVELGYQKNTEEYFMLRSSIMLNVWELYKKKFDKSLEELDNPKCVMNNHFFEKLQMLELRNALSGVESRTDKRIFDETDALINFFFIKIFMIYSNIKSFRTDGGAGAENNSMDIFLNSIDLEKLMNFMEKNNPKDYEILKIYYNMYLARKEPDKDGYFKNFKSTVENTGVVFGIFETSDLFTMLLNISSQRVYLGMKNSVKEKADVLKLMIDKEIFFKASSSMISFRMFGTVLQALLAAKEFTYSQKFYNEHKLFLQESDRENMDNYFYAHKYFYEGNFEKALEYSSKIKPDLEHYKNHIKDIQLKSYFELNDYNSFEYSLNAYRVFIYRNKTITEKNKELYTNYFNALNAIFKWKLGRNLSADEIKFQIEKNTMWDKEWIIKKMEEIPAH